MSTWTRIAVSAALIAPIALAAPVALAELAASPVQEQPRRCSLCATRVVRRPRGTSRRCCWRVWSGWTRRPRYAIGPSPGPNAPDRATLDFTRATIALDRGDLALARSLLDDVVAARPLAGSAWLARTTAGDMAPAQEDRLLALHDRAFATVPTAERAPALYAAGQVLHRRGAHDRAFAHFAAGAAMRRQSLRHDRVADAASAAVATHGTTRARPASN